MLSTPIKGRENDTFNAIDKAFEHISANDDSSRNILSTLLDSEISPYDYEALDYAYKKLHQLEEEDQCEKDSTLILEFLKTYQRTTSPSDDEVDHWINSRSDPFPTELAKIRLPFHPLFKALNNPKDMFSILSNEFTIDSYQSWLNATSIFKLRPHIIRTMAIQQTVKKLCNDFKTRGQDHWHTEEIISQDNLTNIFECIEGIHELNR